VGVFLGHGDGTFSSQTTYSTGYESAPSSVAIGDFNNDSRLDIIVANYVTSTINLFFGYGNGAFSNQVTFSTGSSSGPWFITIGDLNNDNRLDVAVANKNNLGVFVGYGNGNFSSQTMYSTGSGSNLWSVAIGDLNNDGHPDIAVANAGTDNVGLFIGYGNGSFTTQQTLSTIIASTPFSVAVGDFNNDGQLDITVTNYLYNNVGIFLGDGNGTFSSQTTYYTGLGSKPYSIGVGDFNNDSRLDIVVANIGTDNIGVFLGY
jgi:predicted nucleotidyltransferase